MKRLLALLLIAVLVLSVAGCKFSFGTDPGDENEPGENPGEDPGEDPGENPGEDPGPAVQGEFYSFTEMFDVYKVFKELKFTFTAEAEDGDPTHYTYSHVYVGKEELSYTLQGVDYTEVCPQFTITILEDGEETVIDVWFNEAGELVKAGADGDYTTGDLAALAMFGFAFHILPFHAYSDGYAEVFTDEGGFDGYGWVVKEHSTTSRDFGAGSVPVERYRFSWLWIEGDLEYDWEVAKIEGKHVFTKWKMVIGKDLSEMIVERIIPF